MSQKKPLVRCMHHNEKNSIDNILNLSFGYKVYQAHYYWQDAIEKIYGNVEDTIAALENGFQNMPNNQRFYNAYPKLLKLYIIAERTDDADNLITRYKTLIDSKNVYHYGYLGDMLRDMKRNDEELKLYEDLEIKMPKNRIVLPLFRHNAPLL